MQRERTMDPSSNQNETMRHVPPLAFIRQKIGTDYRKQCETLYRSAHQAGQPSAGQEVESEFRGLARSLDRISDLLRSGRHPNGHGHQHPSQELHARLDSAFEGAIRALDGVKEDEYGRRAPYQTFERSRWEMIWTAVLRARAQIGRLIDLLEPRDSSLREALLGHLVPAALPESAPTPE